MAVVRNAWCCSWVSQMQHAWGWGPRTGGEEGHWQAACTHGCAPGGA